MLLSFSLGIGMMPVTALAEDVTPAEEIVMEEAAEEIEETEETIEEEETETQTEETSEEATEETAEEKEKQIAIKVDDSTLLTTHFHEEISNGVLQLSVGSSTEGNEEELKEYKNKVIMSFL